MNAERPSKYPDGYFPDERENRTDEDDEDDEDECNCSDPGCPCGGNKRGGL